MRLCRTKECMEDWLSDLFKQTSPLIQIVIINEDGTTKDVVEVRLCNVMTKRFKLKSYIRELIENNPGCSFQMIWMK